MLLIMHNLFYKSQLRLLLLACLKNGLLIQKNLKVKGLLLLRKKIISLEFFQINLLIRNNLIIIKIHSKYKKNYLIK